MLPFGLIKKWISSFTDYYWIQQAEFGFFGAPTNCQQNNLVASSKIQLIS
jgi:hypothetical protein